MRKLAALLCRTCATLLLVTGCIPAASILITEGVERGIFANSIYCKMPDGFIYSYRTHASANKCGTHKENTKAEYGRLKDKKID